MTPVFNLISCDSTEKKAFPYDMNNDDASNTLSKELREISALSYIGNHKIICVQDEKGVVFVYDYKKNEVSRKIKFEKDGDYEGVALVEDKIYVLKSNGTLYSISGFEKGEDVIVDKITTFLNSKYDAEGLCYDQKNNRLLIACKGKAGEGKKFDHKKAVYAFDLTKQTLQKQASFLIDLKEVHGLKKITSNLTTYEKVANYDGKNDLDINPSAIAIHPITKEIFILSAAGNNLLILSESGEIMRAVHLKSADFKQPEGVTFDELGTMFICNEGRSGKSNIKMFNYKPNRLEE